MSSRTPAPTPACVLVFSAYLLPSLYRATTPTRYCVYHHQLRSPASVPVTCILDVDRGSLYITWQHAALFHSYYLSPHYPPSLPPSFL